MFRINRRLVPIKAHFFFFFAAIGPILPQLNVYGKQLGISPDIMGFITAILPILWALAKPAVGFIVDFFHHHRKLVFMCLILTMSGSYFCIYFLPEPPRNIYRLSENITKLEKFTQFKDGRNIPIRIKQISPDCRQNGTNNCTNMDDIILGSCGLICTDDIKRYSNDTDEEPIRKWKFWITVDDVDKSDDLNVVYYNHTDGVLPACDFFHMDSVNDTENDENSSTRVCTFRKDCKYLACAFPYSEMQRKNISSAYDDDFLLEVKGYNLYESVTFWGFVIFMCTGTVGFNLANCIGDAVCFDVLGDKPMKYGFQRAFGTAGYGLTALISGWLVDAISQDAERKDFTPVFIILAILTLVDLYFCRHLELPSFSRPVDSGALLSKLLRKKTIVIFLIFAVIAGIFDSFIIYYMFWHLEEVAAEQGTLANIKLLEGLIIAVESFGGEILFFALSGRVIKYLGFRNTMTFSLLCYCIRLFAISYITQPWHLVVVEMFLQGPTYALCYSTIVGYAAAVAPPGLSATLQGLMGGMDDGVGFCIGSLVGGVLYSAIGGNLSFKIFGALALCATIAHAALSTTLLRDVPAVGEREMTEVGTAEEGGKLMTTKEKSDSKTMVEVKNCVAENESNE